MVYETRQGDTWDIIAKEVYDDEAQMGILLQNNLQYIDVWVFESGCMIYVPELEDALYEEDDIPDWREDDAQEDTDEDEEEDEEEE